MKKLICILLLLAMALMLFACGTPAEDDDDKDSSKSKFDIFATADGDKDDEQTDADDKDFGDCEHDYVIEENIPATCGEKGMLRYACSKCGHSYSMELPQPDHTFQEADCTRPATCTVCGATEGDVAGHRYEGYYCASCGEETDSFVIPADGYDGSDVTIVFYHTMGAALREVLDSYIAEFNKLYPNIHIQHQQVGSYNDVHDQVSHDITVGNQPNITYCYPDHVALYMLANAVVTMDDFIDCTVEVTRADGSTEVIGMSKAQINDFIDGFYEGGCQFGDGLMYSLPLSKSTEVLYYDKTFFETHGLSVPTTWEEMEVLCQQILLIDPNCIPLAIDSESNWFINMCAQYGSNYTSATGDHYLFNNKTNRGFVEDFRRWYQCGYVTTMSVYGAYSSNLFTSTDATRCYMSIGSSAGARYYMDYDYGTGSYRYEVGITGIPQVDSDDAKVICQGPDLCILKSDNPQEVIASWLFVKFLTTTVEFQADFALASGYIPVLESAHHDYVYEAYMDKADGYSYVAALAAKVAWSQRDAYFTSPAFVGSAQVRQQVGNIVVMACLQDDNGNTKALIKQIFEEALAACP